MMPNHVNKRDRPSQLHIFYNIPPNYVLHIQLVEVKIRPKTFEKTEKKKFINNRFCLKII